MKDLPQNRLIAEILIFFGKVKCATDCRLCIEEREEKEKRERRERERERD